MNPDSSTERDTMAPSSADVGPLVIATPHASSSPVLRLTLYSVCILGAALAFWKLYPYVIPHNVSTATIVASAPLSLDSSTIIINSIKLALEERDYKAGNVDLVLKVLDDGDETGNWVAERELANAIEAVEDETVVAYLGPINSGAAKVSMPVLNKAGIVQVASATTWPGLTKIGFFPGEPGTFYPTGVRHFFRVCTTDDRQGPAGAQWADDMGFKNIYIVNDSDSYGIGIANLFENEAQKLGLNVVGVASISAEPSSYGAVARAIASSTVDMVYYGGITPNGGPEFLAQLRSLGSKAAFMGPDGIFEQDFINRAGSASEGIFITAVGAPPEEVATPGARAFIASYRAAYNAEPDVFGALAYDSTVALIDAMERADTIDRSSVLDKVRDLKNHNGVFGVWSFDDNGDTSLTLMSGNQVKNGSFTFSKVLESE